MGKRLIGQGHGAPGATRASIARTTYPTAICNPDVCGFANACRKGLNDWAVCMVECSRRSADVAVEVESSLDGTVVRTLPVLPEHLQVDTDFINSWMQCVRAI